MNTTQLRGFMKRLGVYHDLYCKDGAPNDSGIITNQTPPAVITEYQAKLSLKPPGIITENKEGLSLTGGPKK